MTATPQPGVRAQNKARTRAAIRFAALDLVTEQGYHATTVAQIAAAAGVSHTTLFRYFESKEQVLVSDDLEDARHELFENAPAGLSHFDLIRHIMRGLFDLAMADEWASNPGRAYLLRTEPTLRMAHQLAADSMLQEGLTLIAEYTGTDESALSLRVFIAAVSGVLMHIVDRVAMPNEDTLAEVLDALDLLEQGLPL